MNSVLSDVRTGSPVQKINCKPLPHIPLPVIGDILLYVPLKNVVQSKTVCKELENLISDREFAKSHFSKSPRGVFVHSEISGNVLHFVDLSDSSVRFKLGGDLYIPHKAMVGRFLSTKLDFRKCFISSCNGLLFFSKTDSIAGYYICNPITRDYTIIPPSSNMKSNFNGGFQERWRSEFGFSPKTGHFKVLRLRVSYKQMAEIFTVGQRSWRSIDIPNNFTPYGKTAFVNGTFHWLSHRDMILSFDVEAETFQEFPFPPKSCSDDNKSASYNYCLGTLKECVSLCRANYGKGHIEIWMLKEYGVTESWIKVFVIDDASKFLNRLKVIWVMEDGEKGQNVLLVCTQSTVVTYDPAGGVCSYLKFDGLSESLTLFPHIPSLIPLKDAIIFDRISKNEYILPLKHDMYTIGIHLLEKINAYSIAEFQEEEESMLSKRNLYTRARHVTDMLHEYWLNQVVEKCREDRPAIKVSGNFFARRMTSALMDINSSSTMQDLSELSASSSEEDKLLAEVIELAKDDLVIKNFFLELADKLIIPRFDRPHSPCDYFFNDSSAISIPSQTDEGVDDDFRGQIDIQGDDEVISSVDEEVGKN